MTDFIDDPNSEEAEKRRKKQGESGEGDSDSFGRGKAGAGAGGGIKITAQKLKQVMANWRQLDMAELMEAVTEFFAESPMRASANCIVSWAKGAGNNVKSFALVNWVIKAGNEAVREVARAHRRGVDTTGRGSAGDSRGRKVTPVHKRATHAKGQNPNFNPKVR